MPVRHAAWHIRRIAGMKLLNRMPLNLRARDALLAKQHLAALMDVPFGARPCLKVDASRPHVDIAFQAFNLSREVCIRIRWLLRGED
jgi:hypothetical protein